MGGYVKFRGDSGAASNPDAEQLEQIKSDLKQTGLALSDVFHFKPLWQRALIVLAGPAANFLLAIVIFAALAMALGSQHRAPVIGSVLPGQPAEAAGFQPGDLVLRMDGKAIDDFAQLKQHVQIRSGSDIETVVLRQGQEVTLIVKPQKHDQKDFVGGKASIGRIGLSNDTNSPLITKDYNPVQALMIGTQQVGDTIGATGTLLGRIFTGKEDTQQLGSVVRIATMTGKSTVDVARIDLPLTERVRLIIIRLSILAASISIALGVANLMPIPALDGGHLLFYSYEAVAGRPLSQKKQELGFRMGFALLMMLFVMLTINDIGYVSSFFS